MTLLREIAGQLLGMFLTDAKLSAAILALVGTIAYLVDIRPAVAPLAGGAALLVGCLAILVAVTATEARRRRHPK